MDVNIPFTLFKDFINHLQSLSIQYFDLTGKTCIVTGGNSGIGFYTALLMAKMNAKVIIASSNLEKSELACEQLKLMSGNNEIEAKHLNLASFNSVDTFIQEFKSQYDKLDILINNAGMAPSSFELTEDEYEKCLQVNYLSPFKLTLGLLPLIENTKDGRIVNVSSVMHKLYNFETQFNFHASNAQNFNLFKEYARTKFYQVLFTRAMSKKLREKKITVVSIHPGWVRTNLGENMKQASGFLKYSAHALDLISETIGRQGEQCGMTSVFAATSDRVVSGGYYDSCVLDFPSKMGKDVDLANQLFDYTLEELKLSDI
ncbi:NAD(P)-binding protein [Conidiobolus coronatus NRRL 28638]|uniref:NAD(P)-binding protein n=1 Tax=Conidiobolus coronatus (strain ATCC 28846 / CBS 209.66 / NRRL 28638) TaxID=796925 RepID=A0A137P1D3_CONC2|nr:NAD(P)-binding protein [Conidiobolus coronatus NRRL 28638]|eukprot:KXN68853.1 NAD(P)-binding protein [Conidiobolus coronatus NRRL 28638]